MTPESTLLAVAEANSGPWRRFRSAASDVVVMVSRNLRHILRTPELLLDVTIQPVIFVLLFVYVFGGAIDTGDSSYVNYLMAGIFVQTLVFAAMSSGIGIASDLQKGLIDRFRSLPMSRYAVVTGRTFTDLIRGMLAVVVTTIVGVFVGFRPEGNVGDWILGFGLLLFFSFAFSWVGVSLAMVVRTPEAVQAALFVFVFPLTFASSAFVPTETMPPALQTFAENQPVTRVIDALRLSLNGQSMGSDGVAAFLWSVGILIVFFPVAMILFRKRTSD